MTFLGIETLTRWLKSRRARRAPVVVAPTEIAPFAEPLVIRAANDNTSFPSRDFDLKTVIAAMNQDRFEFESEREA